MAGHISGAYVFWVGIVKTTASAVVLGVGPTGAVGGTVYEEGCCCVVVQKDRTVAGGEVGTHFWCD